VRFPAPTREDHQRFCQNEGWEQIRDAQGRTGTHHITYKLVLPDGRVLRTRVSHPPDRSGYGARLWSHILRDQLGVDEAEFWACVRGAGSPDRGTPVKPEGAGVPARLVFQLIHDCGLTEKQVAAMTKDDALAALNEYWSRPR